MKPEQFIREFGERKAREVVEGAPDWATHFDLTHKDHYQVEDGEECCLEDLDTVDLSDLKRLVESLGYVSRWGGIERCKRLYFEAPFKRDKHIKDLKRYIRDHESIYGGGDE
ncbi:hypothetical protein [Acinetobacter baumannii]|uniref:hypothetical protein n=1 Tax=Acinetobacter baumannii TaxID=470 RepID=UPI002567D027|nr:hypothetical protein [Acinetobacter baumannii]EKT8141401.1 hypothetical protein [Acinetobacter baumannii]EKU7083942.1 hypothetical protein [Acinetobacter baumannii]EKV1039779.1 hypothetical protein [Acinetobacter baumannii]EKV1043506.1 hypothetical protein [Acinetobacter baumannii]EKV1918624.1 hypothetical protein [Acinetobacter baumannii]